MKEYQEIRDTSPLGLKTLNDQLRLLWFKTKNTSTKDVRDGAITVNKIASDVGKSLDLSSNEAITLRVTKDEFNSLEIGGRNIVRNSDVLVSHTDYAMSGYYMTENWAVGETYTLTIKGKVANTKRFGLWQNAGSGDPVWLPINQDGVASVTFTPKAPIAGWENRFTIYHYPQAIVGTGTIEWIKLEKGNKATDWTPAPEELTEKDKIISEINLSEEAIKIQANKINLVGAVTVLSDIAGNLGTITAGTITGTTVRTDSGSNRIELSSNLLRSFLNGIRRIQLDYDSLDFYSTTGVLVGDIRAGTDLVTDQTSFTIGSPLGNINLQATGTGGSYSIIRANADNTEVSGQVARADMYVKGANGKSASIQLNPGDLNFSSDRTTLNFPEHIRLFTPSLELYGKFNIIRTGSFTATSTAATNVTFSTSMGGTPKIVTQYAESGDNVSGNRGSIKIFNKSFAGFSCIIGGSDDAVARNIDYIAIWH